MKLQVSLSGRRGDSIKAIPQPGDQPKVRKLNTLQSAVLSLLFVIVSGAGAALYTTSPVEQGEGGYLPAQPPALQRGWAGW